MLTIPVTLEHGINSKKFVDRIESRLNIAAAMAPQGKAPDSRDNPAEARPKAGRRPKVASECLLKIAREVFLNRGIRATTAEVAEKAGVAEGTLFHRFKTKEALFRQAMQLSEDDVPEMLIGAVDSIAGLPLEEALTGLAESLMEIGRTALPLMMMNWSNPICGRPSDANVAKFRTFVKHLGAFFEAEMTAGRVRHMDAEVMARTFLGAIHHYSMTRLINQDPSWMIPEGMYVRGLVDVLLRGIQVTPPTPPTSSGDA